MNKKIIWGVVIGVVIIVGAWYVFGGRPSFDGKNGNLLPQETSRNNPVASSTSSFEVLSPKKGDVYKIGSKVNIKWADKSGTNERGYYAIYYVRDEGYAIGNLPAKNPSAPGEIVTDSYDWIVPDISPQDKYKILIVDPTSLRTLGTSGEFTIIK